MNETVVVYSKADVRRRSWALLALSLGSLLITVDISIVNVALPAIKTDLSFSNESILWVVDAYLASFGGFLLLAGRLGDVLGQRRMFLSGVALFTLASFACGVAQSRQILIGARAMQGFGGAIVSVLTVALLMRLFKEAPERARALGAYAFVCTGGGSLGLMFGGTLTSVLGWHWIFLVNVPLGPAIYILSSVSLPKDGDTRTSEGFDAAGAVTVTTSVFLALYVIINGNRAGWQSAQTLLGLIMVAVLLAAFVRIQSLARAPLMPLELLCTRDFMITNLINMVSSAAAFGWFFIYARFLQTVLQYDPLHVALAYLPANAAVAVVSVAIAPWLIARFGTGLPLIAGQLVAAAGLAILACTPSSASPLVHEICGMFLLGGGTGTANAALLLGAMNQARPGDSGIASGIIRTSSVMGGALGLSILGSIAVAHAERLVTAGADLGLATESGYRSALYLGACLLVAAASLSALLGLPQSR